MTYDNHGKQDETSTGGLLGAYMAVDQVVCAGGSQDQATGKVSNNLIIKISYIVLLPSIFCSLSTWGRGSYRDAVNIAGIGSKGKDQANNHTEHITSGPPVVVWVTILGLSFGYNR